MMLVINCAGKVLVDDIWENRACSYKIVNCPELSQAQQAALIDRLSPLVVRTLASDGLSDMPIVGWSLENDDFVTTNENTVRADTNDPTWSEPSCDYLDAIVWNGIGQKAFS